MTLALTRTTVALRETAGARYALQMPREGLAPASAAFGLALPERIGEGCHGDSRSALCVGPDEWLLLAQSDTVVAEAFAALALPHSLVEVSSRDVTIHIDGPDALTLLAMGTPIDVSAIAVGDGTRTVFAHTPVTLWRDGPETVRVDVWRSFAPHVHAVLTDGQRELAAGF